MAAKAKSKAAAKPAKSRTWLKKPGRPKQEEGLGRERRQPLQFLCPPTLKAEMIELIKKAWPHATKSMADYIIEAISEKNERTRALIGKGRGGR